MGKAITFTSSCGHYTIQLPDAPPYEDTSLTVIARDGEHHWHVEVEEAEGGVVVLKGLARGPFLDLIDGKNALWFELRLDKVAAIRYWSDQVIVRTDTSPNAI